MRAEVRLNWQRVAADLVKFQLPLRLVPVRPCHHVLGLRLEEIVHPGEVSPAEEDAGLDISGFGEEDYVGEAGQARSSGVRSDS